MYKIIGFFTDTVFGIFASAEEVTKYINAHCHISRGQIVSNENFDIISVIEI